MFHVSAFDGQNAGDTRLTTMSEADAVPGISGYSSRYADGAPLT